MEPSSEAGDRGLCSRVALTFGKGQLAGFSWPRAIAGYKAPMASPRRADLTRTLR